MKITAIRSDALYRKMMCATKDEKETIYREELMKPFELKFRCIGIPLKAENSGHDVVSAATMSGGYTPAQITEDRLTEIEAIGKNAFWTACEDSIRNTLEGFERQGIRLPTQEYMFTVLLSDPKNPITVMNGDTCGDGGIPGYIIGTIVPNEKSLQMLPVALAHEANHNIRWQFMKWNPGITLGDMVVSEGLAENFAAVMFGEDKIGKWVTETDQKTLETVIKPTIRANLAETDFNKLSSYLYGDKIMAMRGAAPVGMPYCGGYACGYALIRHYLHKTGKNIYEATITPTNEILQEGADFWNSK